MKCETLHLKMHTFPTQTAILDVIFCKTLKIIQNMMGFFVCQTIKVEYKIGLNSCIILETAIKKNVSDFCQLVGRAKASLSTCMSN